MSYQYSKQNWEMYDKTLPSRLQEDSIITKKRLEHMEDGIERNSMPLVIGDLINGDSEMASGSVVVDEDAQEVKLNLVFPKQSQIDDSSVYDDATWSSRKIRQEIDDVASNTKYTCEVYTDEGLLFVAATDVKTLKARILKSGEDITNDCNLEDMIWTRKSSNTDMDDFWNGKGYSGRSITVSASDLNDATNVTYFCSYNGSTVDGAKISAKGNVTVSNMVYEVPNTSVSFSLNTPNGDIFDNKSDSMLLIEAEAYQGTQKITDLAEYRWFMNGLWLPGYTTSRFEYPVSGLALVTTFTCEMTYELLSYRNSVTIQNRKNVTVSSAAPNDPQIGDIWYDTELSMYKKWTSDGWEVISDPSSEITGDILITIDAIKSTQEIGNELSTLRQNTYKEINAVTGEIEKLHINLNNVKESSDRFERTLTQTTSDLKGVSQTASQALQKADRVSWLVKDDSTSTSLSLTPSFARLISENVDITGVHINLRGYTTINDDGTGGVTITEDGYLVASKGGSIGPWNIGDDNIYMTSQDGSIIYIGKEGLNFSNNLVLKPDGTINTRKFKVDPVNDYIELDADILKLGGVTVTTIDDSVGARNIIISSGNYHPQKTVYWNIDDIPWDMSAGPVGTSTEEEGNSIDVNTTETYMSFRKIDDVDTDEFITLPLSTKLTTGKYIFNVRAFKGSTDLVTLKLYLVTNKDEDGTRRYTMIGSSELTTLANNYTFIYNHNTSADYKYVAIRCSDYNIDTLFNIVNMSMYRSEIVIKDWSPAPEDGLEDYDFLSDSFEETTNTITTVVSDLKGEIFTQISSIFESDGWAQELTSIFSQNSSGVSVETYKNYFDQSTADINSSLSDQKDKVERLYQYINLIDGDITLGNNQSPIVLTISNEKVSFVENGVSETAYFSSNRMFVEELEAVQQLKIGNFAFLPRSDGRLSIRMVGKTQS